MKRYVKQNGVLLEKAFPRPNMAKGMRGFESRHSTKRVGASSTLSGSTSREDQMKPCNYPVQPGYLHVEIHFNQQFFVHRDYREAARPENSRFIADACERGDLKFRHEEDIDQALRMARYGRTIKHAFVRDQAVSRLTQEMEAAAIGRLKAKVTDRPRLASLLFELSVDSDGQSASRRRYAHH